LLDCSCARRDRLRPGQNCRHFELKSLGAALLHPTKVIN
jgi:hypothetical protein